MWNIISTFLLNHWSVWIYQNMGYIYLPAPPKKIKQQQKEMPNGHTAHMRNSSNFSKTILPAHWLKKKNNTISVSLFRIEFSFICNFFYQRMHCANFKTDWNCPCGSEGKHFYKSSRFFVVIIFSSWKNGVALCVPFN